jgi:hypothetical protein
MLSITNICLPVLALRAWPSKKETPNPHFFMMPYGFILTAIHLFIPLVSVYVILKKLNYNGLWVLFAFFPFFIIIFLWVVAFKKSKFA